MNQEEVKIGDFGSDGFRASLLIWSLFSSIYQ